MWLAYLDESYTKERYCIAAVLVPADQARSLSDTLDQVVADAAERYGDGITPTTELHGYEIVSGADGWSAFADKVRPRVAVYRAALEAIVEHDVRIVLRSMDVPGQRRRYAYPDHPHGIVLTHLIERIDEEVERLEDWAILIADEISEENEHRRSLWEYQRTQTWGYRRRQITRIVDTIHFAPSSSSRLLQAADLIAYEYRRGQTHEETDERSRAAHRDLRKIFQPKVVHSHCWFPNY